MDSNFRQFQYNPTSSLNYTYNSAIDSGRDVVLKHRREAIQIELEKERVREKIFSDRLRLLEAELRRELVREHGGFPLPLTLGQPHRFEPEVFEPENRRFLMPVQERYDHIENVPIGQGKFCGLKRKAPTPLVKEDFRCVVRSVLHPHEVCKNMYQENSIEQKWQRR